MLSASLSERYDSNVMLQDEGAQAGEDSFVTTVLPDLGVRTSGTGETRYTSGLRYAPDFSFFHGLSRESYLRHIGVFDFDIRHQGFTALANVGAQYTDGSTEVPLWGTTADPGAVPALGAPEVRNRRRNMYFTSNTAVRQDVGRWFVRGAFDARIWDFMTDDVLPPAGSGLVVQNYYDRNDLNGGVDFGYQLGRSVEAYAGFRLGHQDQEYRLVQPGDPNYSYQNTYYRVPIGLVAKASSWLKFSGEIGPSVHVFDESIMPPGSEGTMDFLYFLASASVQLATNTSLKLSAGQHLIPASAGQGVFQNTTAAGTLTRNFSQRFSGSFKVAYTEYDFIATFSRKDRRLIPEVRFDYHLSRVWCVGAWYAYEHAWSALPNTSNRDYSRHIGGVVVKAAL